MCRGRIQMHKHSDGFLLMVCMVLRSIEIYRVLSRRGKTKPRF